MLPSDDESASKKTALIIPHWNIAGGSGKYTKDLEGLLADDYDVSYGGPFAPEFTENNSIIAGLNGLARHNLPLYHGVGFLSFVKNAFASSIVFLLKGGSPSIYAVAGFNVVIFTSSVQIFAAWLTQRRHPNIVVAVLIQENTRVTGMRGLIFRTLAKTPRLIISISDSWQAKAQRKGVTSVVHKNSFAPPPDGTETAGRDDIVNSDVIYVGGDAAIKGYDVFKRSLPVLLGEMGCRVVALGDFSECSRNALYETVKDIQSGSLTILGHVSCIDDYLRQSKVLLIPITHPHFCRPAIEAGLQGIPFVISDHEGLEDFVRPDFNCMTFKNASEKELVAAIRTLLSDDMSLQALGTNNKIVAQDYLRDSEGYKRSKADVLAALNKVSRR